MKYNNATSKNYDVICRALQKHGFSCGDVETIICDIAKGLSGGDVEVKGRPRIVLSIEEIKDNTVIFFIEGKNIRHGTSFGYWCFGSSLVTIGHRKGSAHLVVEDLLGSTENNGLTFHVRLDISSHHSGVSPLRCGLAEFMAVQKAVRMFNKDDLNHIDIDYLCTNETANGKRIVFKISSQKTKQRRGCGYVFRSRNGVSLKSIDRPACGVTTLFLRGGWEQDDEISIDAAEHSFYRILEAVIEYNARESGQWDV